MGISEKLILLDNAILDLEIAIRKAEAITDNLAGDYFCLTEDEKTFIQSYHDRAGVFNSISLDYIVKVTELIKVIGGLLDSIRETQKEESSKPGNSASEELQAISAGMNGHNVSDQKENP